MKSIEDGRKNSSINPFLPSYEYLPGGEPRIFNNRLYIYASHDLYDQNKYCGGDYVTWSASINDLSKWQYEGVIFKREQDPFINRLLRKEVGSVMKTHLFTPDVIEIEGKYYMYYGVGISNAGFGVAVSDSPTGPFTYVGRVKYPGNDEIPYGNRRSMLRSVKTYTYDPAVIYDNGRLFLYFGLAFCRVVELDIRDKRTVIKNEDTNKYYSNVLVPSIVYSKSKKKKFNGIGMVSSPSIRRINNMYYLTYYGKGENKSNVICAAYSYSPYGPFKYAGTLVSVGNTNYNGQTKPTMYDGNTHGGMVEIDGKWFIIYHRHAGKKLQNRQTMVANISFNEDGTINQGEHNCLGFSTMPLDPFYRWPAYMASDIYNSHGELDKDITPYFIQIEEDFGDFDPDSEKNLIQVITNIKKESVIGYRTFDFKDNKNVRVSLYMKAISSGYVTIHLDNYKSKEIIRMEINKTNEYQELTSELAIIGGIHNVYFKFHPIEAQFGEFAFFSFTTE